MLHLVAVGVVVWCVAEGVILLDQRQQLLPQGLVHPPARLNTSRWLGPWRTRSRFNDNDTSSHPSSANSRRCSSSCSALGRPSVPDRSQMSTAYSISGMASSLSILPFLRFPSGGVP